MFRNLSISAKLFLTFVPIFAFGIGLSVYLTTVSQEEQMQAQALESATQKARIVREALVNMMVESQVVDDRWLERVRTVADLNDLYIRIDTASLRLAEDYMDSSRTVRLWERVQKAQAKDEFDNRYGAEVLTTGKQQWLRIGDVLGVAHIEFPLTAIIKANEENARRTAFISGGIALLVIGAGFVFFRSLVQRPLKRLEKAAEEIGKGEMSAELDLPEGGDEVGPDGADFGELDMRRAGDEKLVQAIVIDGGLHAIGAKITELVKLLKINRALHGFTSLHGERRQIVAQIARRNDAVTLGGDTKAEPLILGRV